METGNDTNYDKQLIANESNRYFTDILQKLGNRKDSDSVTFDDLKLSNFVSSRLNAGTTFGILEIIPKLKKYRKFKLIVDTLCRIPN